MKKLNNKGFAITALLYGLSIVGFTIVAVTISIMQNQMDATSDLTEAIEGELNNYSKSTHKIEGSGIYEGWTIESGQDGYYLIELYGGGPNSDYVSGMIYLNEGSSFRIVIGDNTDSSISYGGETIMVAGKNGGNSKVKGMAKFNSDYSTSENNKFFFNGQIRKGIHLDGEGKIAINKISSTFPINMVNSVFNQNGTLSGSSTMNAVIVPKDKLNTPTEIPRFRDLIKSGTNITVSSGYILADVFTTNVTSVSYAGSTLSGTTDSIKATDGIEYQLFNPSDANNIKEGNYYISLATESGSKTEINLSNLMTAPLIEDDFTNAENRKYLYKMTVFDEYTSYGKKVVTQTFIPNPTQKWRIENKTGHYGITDVDDHKPMEFDKTDGDTTTGESGPILVSGKYKVDAKEPKIIKAAESIYSDNLSQQWTFEYYGYAGLWKLKSNICNGTDGCSTRYLKCNGTKNICYLDPSNASLFNIINADY